MEAWEVVSILLGVINVLLITLFTIINKRSKEAKDRSIQNEKDILLFKNNYLKSFNDVVSSIKDELSCTEKKIIKAVGDIKVEVGNLRTEMFEKFVTKEERRLSKKINS